jgi:hypothetical protein
MTPVRRREDGEGEDFSYVRGGRSNGHARWVVATVSASIVASLGYLVVRDRIGVDQQITRLDNAVISAATLVSQHEAQIQVMKAKQDRVLEDLKENGRKLDQLLLEVRRK